MLLRYEKYFLIDILGKNMDFGLKSDQIYYTGRIRIFIVDLVILDQSLDRDCAETIRYRENRFNTIFNTYQKYTDLNF